MFKSKKSKANSNSSASNSYDEKTCDDLFLSLCDSEEPDVVSMDGVIKFGEMLDIDPTADVRILVLMWKLGAKSKPGCIKQDEFKQGMRTIDKSSVDSLKSYLPALDPGFLDKDEFRDFFKFVFQFSREGTNKTIEKEVIESLLLLVLDNNRAPHLPAFINFLQQCGHKRITLDQWDSFLQFNYSVDVGLVGYEDDGAWPLLLDEYVEWRKAGNA